MIYFLGKKKQIVRESQNISEHQYTLHISALSCFINISATARRDHYQYLCIFEYVMLVRLNHLSPYLQVSKRGDMQPYFLPSYSLHSNRIQSRSKHGRHKRLSMSREQKRNYAKYRRELERQGPKNHSTICDLITFKYQSKLK